MPYSDELERFVGLLCMIYELDMPQEDILRLLSNGIPGVTPAIIRSEITKILSEAPDPQALLDEWNRSSTSVTFANGDNLARFLQRVLSVLGTQAAS